MNNIRQARKAKKISQKKLAELMGITPQAVSLYEKNQRKPNEKVYQFLSEILDADIDYLKGNIYGKDELLTMFNNSYLNKYSFLKPRIRYYLEFINTDKPENIFTMKQLENLDDAVKAYWLSNFGFIFNEKYKKDSDKTMLLGVPDKLALQFIHKIFDEIRKYSKSKAQMQYNRDVKPVIEQFIDTADLVTAYGSKKQIIEFNNRLIETINKFSETIEKIPENPNIDSKKVDKYLKRLK